MYTFVICIWIKYSHATCLENKLNNFGCVRRYVVDAADFDNLSVSRSELHDLLSKPSLNGIPLLVLGNKIDKSGALSKQDFTEQM